MILSFTPNPCVDKTLEIDELHLGEKHRKVKMGCVAGGKGNNAARCVARLGREAAALVVVAGHTGAHVVQMIEEDDRVRCIPYWTHGFTRTITTIYESGPHRQTALFEAGPDLSADEVGALLRLYAESLPGVRVVTLNGAVPCNSMKNIYADMICGAQSRGIPVLLDAYGEEFDRALACGPHCVKVNRDEAAATLGFPPGTREEYLRALAVYQEQGVRIAIISDGPNDIFVAWESERFVVTPPKVREVNPVGSGDVFAGCISIALAEGWQPDAALRYAAAAGAANAASWDIGHFGGHDEIQRLCAETRCERLA